MKRVRNFMNINMVNKVHSTHSIILCSTKALTSGNIEPMEKKNAVVELTGQLNLKR